MASSPVATAAQAVEQEAAARPAAQTTGAGSKPAQSNAVQDTVTLSNGIPQQTPAEEAGLFQITAPTLNSAPARGFLNSANPNTENRAASGSGPNATAVAATAAGAALPTPAIHPEPRVAAANRGSTAVTTAATTAPAVPANTNAAVPGAALANPASAGGTQAAASATSQSQTVLEQFTEYLQQLGLSPQAVNQMLQAAQILNNLDPPAMQQAIGELRAQAATLAAQASGAPLSTAPTVRAGVSSSAAEGLAQPGAASAASGTTSK